MTWQPERMLCVRPRWAELADTVLVFVSIVSGFSIRAYTVFTFQAGLFVAFLSDFLLSPPTKQRRYLKRHPALQLSNSSVPAFVEPQLIVSASAAAANNLIFASLALVLVDAYPQK